MGRFRGMLTGLIAAAFSLGALPAAAQGLFIYPSKGQTQEQQSRDRYECHSWAVQQSGFDPSRSQIAQSNVAPGRPPPSEAPRGGLFRGAARGAALGAVGGAIAGNAGKGAAIGAITTTLFGGIKRQNRQQQEEQWRQQQYQQQQYEQQQYEQQIRQLTHNYNRAYSACMSARQYQVQ